MPLKIEAGISERQIVPGGKKLTEISITLLQQLMAKEIGTEKQRNTLVRILQYLNTNSRPKPPKFRRIIDALKQQTGRSTL